MSDMSDRRRSSNRKLNKKFTFRIRDDQEKFLKENPFLNPGEIFRSDLDRLMKKMGKRRLL